GAESRGSSLSGGRGGSVIRPCRGPRTGIQPTTGEGGRVLGGRTRAEHRERAQYLDRPECLWVAGDADWTGPRAAPAALPVGSHVHRELGRRLADRAPRRV
ncbi:MAG: hypothetical protein AVDCRST_MAG70-2502, partial [uncultured Thermomicrobiales bacterium]